MAKYSKRNKRSLELMAEAIQKTKVINEAGGTKRIGFPQQHLSPLKKGTRSFTIEQLIKIAKFHNTTTDYLLGLTDVRVRTFDKLDGLGLIEEGLNMLKMK